MFLMKNKTLYIVGYEEDGEVVPEKETVFYNNEREAQRVRENKERFSDREWNVYEVMNLEMTKRPRWIGGTREQQRENTSCSKDY